jgi:hypothetical protein
LVFGVLAVELLVRSTVRDTSTRLPESEKSMSDNETIERAAIFYNNVIYSVPRPGRHHTVIQMMAKDNFPTEAMSLKNQGFVTSTGRFVDRYEGAKIARAAGQIIREPTPPDMLTSEDVW